MLLVIPSKCPSWAFREQRSCSKHACDTSGDFVIDLRNWRVSSANSKQCSLPISFPTEKGRSEATLLCDIRQIDIHHRLHDFGASPAGQPTTHQCRHTSLVQSLHGITAILITSCDLVRPLSNINAASSESASCLVKHRSQQRPSFQFASPWSLRPTGVKTRFRMCARETTISSHAFSL